MSDGVSQMHRECGKPKENVKPIWYDTCFTNTRLSEVEKQLKTLSDIVCNLQMIVEEYLIDRT